ncbi:MASE3 domain-containing protein [uncultured Methanoregula sp.]|uniref:MASE3 domain-containing protein n=1 Tax=uncultured Methanoregula sp. TaxID=1005933 RepID=UPI003748806F
MPESTKRFFLPITILSGAIAAAILIGLYLISLQNYILFHGIVELAGIAVAFSIFIIVWNTRRDIDDAFFLIVGISFLFIGSIDLVHTLAYKGMGIFPGNNSDLPTQLWIAGRYFQSITFLVATLFIGRTITRDRKYDTGIIVSACTAACVLIFLSIFVWQNFPQCFIESTGLTPFKIASEYVISAILIATIIILYRRREHFDPTVWHYLIAAQAFLIFGELAFTSYVSVYGFMNMLGHLFRLLSVYFFYRAFVVIALTQPYDLLLRKIRQDEYALNERFKELNCLYSISALLEQPEISTSEILAKTVTFLSPAMQFPENAEARIVLDGQTFQTVRFRETPWMLVREILVNGTPVGRVEVCYLEERPAIHKGPFIEEERHLIHAVAERMGHIIERTRAEDALRSNEEKYRTLFDNMLEGFAYCRMIYDAEGRPADWEYIDVNRKFGQLTGLQDIKGKRVLEAIPGIRELAPELFDTYGRVASTGTPETFDIDFKPLKMWLKVSVFSPSKGYFVAVFENITERKRADDDIRMARDFYLKILDDFPNPIWRADLNGKCDYFNRDWLAFTGRSIEQELGDGWAEGVHPDDLERCVKTYLDHFHARTPFEMEYRLRYHDGTYHWLNDSGKPFYMEEGKFAGYIGSCYDIQNRRQAEEALRQMNNKLNLLSSITRHDIRNQLMALNAYISLSEDAIDKPAELKGFFTKEQKIADAITRQIAFTKDYEDLGVKSPVWQNVSVLVRDAGTAHPMRNIALETRCPSLEVFADPLLEKVFYNLIDNSLGYGGEKMTTIRVIASEGKEDLRILYEDDGNGISADDKKELFRKGFGRHTGLGLFLSREILQITGITITENGEPGKGVRFEIVVPKGVYRFTDRT